MVMQINVEKKDFDGLREHKSLLNPTKLSIVLILQKNIRVEASMIRKILGIGWGTFGGHVNSLIENGYVGSTREFISGNPRVVLFLEPKGILAINDLREFLE